MTEDVDHPGASQTVVFDTNVLIPLAIPASRSARLFSRLERAGWRVAVSPQILQEVEEKLRTKSELRRWLGLSEQDIEGFVQRLATMCRLVKGIAQAHGAVPADPDDDIIVAAAVEARATYLISEDKHLLELKEYERVMILSRDDFRAELDRFGI